MQTRRRIKSLLSFLFAMQRRRRRRTKAHKVEEVLGKATLTPKNLNNYFYIYHDSSIIEYGDLLVGGQHVVHIKEN